MKRPFCLLPVAALCAALLPATSRAITAANLSDGSLSGNTLTVSADISGVVGETTLALWIGQAEPKDGDPAALLAAATAPVSTVSVTADGNYTLSGHVVLGTKVAFKIVATDGNASAETGVKTMKLKDETEYYCNNKSGVWSDPSIWDKGTDNGNRLGYPSYGSKFIFSGGTCNVQVDAEYTDLAGKSMGWNNVNVTLIGTVPGAALKGGYGLECYSANLTLDAVRVECASYDVKSGKSLRLVNGAYMSSRWWITANADNSTIYVGSGSTISASTEWWYGIQISGENSVLEIEDAYVYTPRLHIGRGGSANTPKGIRFLGTNPRMDVSAGFLITKSDLAGSPILEFVVPYGGYSAAPLQRDRGNAEFMFAGHSYLDHPDAVHGAPPIKFKISERSPFFTQEDVMDVLLVDWSYNGSSSAGINTDATDCGISFVAFEDSVNNSFFTDSNVAGVDATRVWAHLSGTGEPFSRTLVAPEITGTLEGSTLTTTASLSDFGDGTATATLYVGHAGPAGDPTANMSAVDSATLTDNSGITLSAPNIVFGSQTAYAIVVVNTQGAKAYTSSTVTNVMQVNDSGVQYIWVNNTTGAWSNPDNWTCAANDGKSRLGYPSYGNSVRWYGNQTAVVYVDGPYTGLGDAFVDNPGLNLTLVGTVEGASALFGNTHTTYNTHITLDNVTSSSGGFGVGNNGEFWLVNGASFSTAWRCEIEGDHALLHVGDGCTLTVATSNDGYEYRLGLAGEGSRIEIDNGTVVTRCLKIGKTKTAVPDGIVFTGTNPVLRVAKQFRIEQALDDGGSPTFLFSVPIGGYAQAPIQRNGSDRLFLDQSKGTGVPPVLFAVDRRSPFFQDKNTMDVPLVAWNNAAGINTDGIVFESSDSVRFFYTPEEGATKTGLWVNLQGHGFTMILFR